MTYCVSNSVLGHTIIATSTLSRKSRGKKENTKELRDRDAHVKGDGGQSAKTYTIIYPHSTDPIRSAAARNDVVSVNRFPSPSPPSPPNRVRSSVCERTIQELTVKLATVYSSISYALTRARNRNDDSLSGQRVDFATQRNLYFAWPL